MVDTLIKNGKIVTGDGIVQGGIAIEEGRIVSIASDQYLPEGAQTIDAGGKYIIPGLIDPQAPVGIRAVKATAEEEMQRESAAALVSGVTTWGIELTSNPLDEELAREEDNPLFSRGFPTFQKKGEQNFRNDFFFMPIFVTEAQILEIPRLYEQFGITSFKFYLHLRTRRIIESWFVAQLYGYKEDIDDGSIFQAFELISELGPPAVACIHPQNLEISRVLQARLKEAGRNDMAAWDEASPDFCEVGYVRNWAYYAKVTNCPIHLMHVTSEAAINEIKRARAEGIRITALTSPDHLALDREVWKKTPPLRDRSTREKLWEGLRDGLINCLGTDHVNLMESRELMRGEDVWSMRTGFSSRVEGYLPVMLSEGVNKGRISLQRMVQVACENPAKIFGLYPQKGTIRVGSDADLVVIDLDLTRKVNDDQILSMSGWTVYAGQEMKGWPVMVVLRGDVVMEWPKEEIRPKIIGTPKGRYLRRGSGYQSYPLVE